ncbi:TlpA family protein disulfide reductase [Chitinophaga tropicalis]|uniref:Redoxin family protein n=1 Tax=Chitinophaga tropicalis TaxID=2683588 RepID=A0A7K1TZX4_9BACT|nr:TlpA disulfide reductase family protein [Chitinophaga tropicalis]MVT07664.1 redoxin family protein [Chitinophaga tropicalis]
MQTLAVKIFIGLFLIPFQIKGSTITGLDSVRISGLFSFLKKVDTVIIYEYPLGYALSDISYKEHVIRTQNGNFQINLPIQRKSATICIRFPSHYDKSSLVYLVTPGDNVIIKEEDAMYSFKGTGATKFYLANRLKEISNQIKGRFILNDNNLDELFKKEETVRKKKLEIIDSLHSAIPQNVADYYKAQSILTSKTNIYLLLNLSTSRKNLNYENRIALLNKYYYGGRRTIEEASLGDPCLISSEYFVKYVIEKYRFDSCTFIGKDFSVFSCYKYVTEHFTGEVREKLIAALLSEYELYIVADELVALSNDAHTYLRDEIILEYFRKMLKAKLPGGKLPEFYLTGSSGRAIRLSQLRGTVLLLDFWFTSCGGCREIHPLLDSIRDLYKGLPFKVVSISVDKNRSIWLESLKKGKYTSPENINLYTSGNGQLDPIITFFNINAYPTLLLIDKDGKVMGTPRDPRLDNGVGMISMINLALKEKKDK